MHKKTDRKKTSNTINHRINYKVEIFVISILTVALIFLGWAFIFQETNKYKASIVDSFGDSQQIFVNQAAKNVQNGLEAYTLKAGYTMEKAEEAVVTNVIKKAESSGNRYWFFYSEDRVIFERDTETTKNIKGIKPHELQQFWKLQGGSGMEALAVMLSEGRNGSVVFSKDSDIGNEIISVSFFAIGGKEYYFGMSTQQKYALSTANVNEHILYLWTFSALVTLDILIFSMILCLRIQRHQRESEKLSRSIVNKSLQIQELNRKLSLKSEAVQNASIYDSLTKLYNRKFFDNLTSRIQHELLMPISIVILDINGLGQLNASDGYNAGDELLEKTSEILHKVCIDTDVVARTGSSEFTILMTATRESEAYGTARNIQRQFASFDNMELTLSFGVAQMYKKEDSIFEVLEAARKNLVLEKMLDSNSISNSIISMMMVTLNAYSRETVNHSNRMREMAVKLGMKLRMSPSELSRLAVATQLHDVGKIGIPDSILNKKERLSDHERELIRRHPELGFNITNAIPFMNEVAVDILQHHESWDGTGYPHGMKGEAISLNARIINIVDSYDAMTNESIYKTRRNPEEAIEDLRKNSGYRYDPQLVSVFVREIAASFQEGNR